MHTYLFRRNKKVKKNEKMLQNLLGLVLKIFLKNKPVFSSVIARLTNVNRNNRICIFLHHSSPSSHSFPLSYFIRRFE